jgi:hypothetical protein
VYSRLMLSSLPTLTGEGEAPGTLRERKTHGAPEDAQTSSPGPFISEVAHP